MEKYNLLRLAQ